MAIKKFQEFESDTGVGGDYCAITDFKFGYDANINVNGNPNMWTAVVVTINVWRDLAARQANKRPIKGLSWKSTIFMEEFIGTTLNWSPNEFMTKAYNYLKLNDPKLMDSTDI